MGRSEQPASEPDIRRKVVVALTIGLFFYALSDLLLWQRIFEQHSLFQFDYQYQSGHVSSLVAMIGIGVVLLWDVKLWAVWYAAAFYTLAFSGLEDILYYWLDGKWIPATLPWLNTGHLILVKPVTSWSLLLSAGLWIMFWAATLVAIPLIQRLARVSLQTRPRTP